MPIFISYSRNDTAFVDTLVRNLVAARHHVWMDRWELGLGDSLTQRIQDALTASSAILVILSKNSVSSEWCKRELTAGLVRELEERKTIVMPCVIDDCDIPLFLRDKLYADFRANPDEAFGLVDRALSQVSNPMQGRSESPNFFTDFSLDWGAKDDGPLLRLMFVDHGGKLPYVVWSLCEIYCNERATEEFWAHLKEGKRNEHIKSVLELLVADFKTRPLTEKITNNFEKFVAWPLKGTVGKEYFIRFRYRRLGIDNGFDTLVHLDANIEIALQRFDDVMSVPDE
jgi:TIR domain